MNISRLILFGLWPVLAWGQLEVVPDEMPSHIFAATPQTIRVLFRNKSADAYSGPIIAKILQASSATLMPVGELKPERTIHACGHQTVVEDISITLPDVKSAVVFELNWLNETGSAIGRTRIVSYPNSLLAPLKRLVAGQPILVVDPLDELIPTLELAGVPVVRLRSADEVSDHRACLAIINGHPLSQKLPEQVIDRVKNGGAVVWVKPVSQVANAAPLVFALRLGKGTLVVAQKSTVTRFAQLPLSQVNLVHYAEWALDPSAAVGLPDE